MPVQLWEWAITRGARHGTSGVSGTRRGAMEALSRTMVEGGGSAHGKVGRMALVHGVWEPFYMHGIAHHVAEYEEGVIHWRSGLDSPSRYLTQWSPAEGG